MTDQKDMMTLKTSLTDPDPHPHPHPVADNTTPQATAHIPQPPREASAPLMGIFSVLFGFLSIFTFAPLFAPLAVIFGIISLFMGQVLWGISAIGLAVIGVVTSPTLLAIASAGAFLALLGF